MFRTITKSLCCPECGEDVANEISFFDLVRLIWNLRPLTVDCPQCRSSVELRVEIDRDLNWLRKIAKEDSNVVDDTSKS
jgi:endogenous inhibitor of DNA gyrase (YacG/DUF329 family)